MLIEIGKSYIARNGWQVAVKSASRPGHGPHVLWGSYDTELGDNLQYSPGGSCVNRGTAWDLVELAPCHRFTG